ncbi:MAG: UvrD-helicase domain-containing protein [Bacilli bacterium]
MMNKTKEDKIVFSPKQEEALSLVKENILVSAGAGSGKTAVLVERIIRILVDKEVPLDRILVLTFTKAGAQEFKNRIKKALREKPEHASKAFAVDNADITTFDAYALKILRKYGYYADLDSDVVNLDQGLELVLMRRYFDEVMEDYYKDPPLAFRYFTKRFLSKKDDKLFELITKFDSQLKLQIDAETYLKNYIEKFYSDAKFEAIYKEFNEYVVNTIRKVAQAIKNLNCERHLQKYEAFLNKFGQILSFDDYMNNLDSFIYQNRPAGTLRDYPEDRPFANIIKEYIGDLKSIQVYESRAKMYEIFQETKKHAAFVLEIYRKIRERLAVFKNEKSAYTFSDIAYNAYRLVCIPKVQNELRNQYEYILIDEYQDTSDIQEQFIQKIANNNVYMVGDIKQSIYAFRNANCDIFREKYARYRTGKEGKKVDLNDNYRSRPEVLNAINAILNELMTEDFGGANYKREHQINQGNKKYDKFKVPNQKVGLEVINYTIPKKNKDEPLANESIRKSFEYETEYIVRDIERKIKEKYQVLEKDGLRDVRYGDFTILLSQGTKFDDIERRFIDAGIPVYVHRDEKASENNINIAINNLLRIYIAYTKDDEPRGYEFRLAVASFLRGFVNNYTDQALFDLLKDENWDFTSDPVLMQIKHLAQTSNHLPVSKIIDKLVTTFDIYGALFNIADLTQNNMKLLNKLEEIENLAALGLDLEEIVNYFGERERIGVEVELKRVKLEKEAVNIMTIHSSKGLEFPIVYYMDLANNFYRMERRQTLAICPKYGFILPDSALKTQKSFLGYLADIRYSIETLSERIRLLYVALTRAKELMVIIHPLEEKMDELKPFEKTNSLKNLLLQSPYYQSLIKEVEIEFLPFKDVEPKKGDFATEFIIKNHGYSFESVKSDFAINEKNDVDEKVLQRGILLHRYFEEYDFETKSLDYIMTASDREHIRNLVALPLFAGVENGNIYREYEFIDDNTNKTYAIDCFVVLADKIILIDLKLANIDHPSYDLQVENYARYLKKVFRLPVNAYLLSILHLKYRKVEINE